MSGPRRGWGVTAMLVLRKLRAAGSEGATVMDLALDLDLHETSVRSHLRNLLAAEQARVTKGGSRYVRDRWFYVQGLTGNR